MKTINVWKDPFGKGFDTCKADKIKIRTGVTILVGCNGSGKSTMIKNIKDCLDKEKEPYILYDNEYDGGSNSIGEAMLQSDLQSVSSLVIASEGERIHVNLGRLLARMISFIGTGIPRMTNYHGSKYDKKVTSKNRWILLDAIDSGYSIDNIIELKEIFNLIIKDARSMDRHVYIIAVANEYELAHKQNCLDVTTGEYIKFKNYEDYKKFVLHTKELKDKRFKDS